MAISGQRKCWCCLAGAKVLQFIWLEAGSLVGVAASAKWGQAFNSFCAQKVQSIARSSEIFGATTIHFSQRSVAASVSVCLLSHEASLAIVFCFGNTF